MQVKVENGLWRNWKSYTSKALEGTNQWSGTLSSWTWASWASGSSSSSSSPRPCALLCGFGWGWDFRPVSECLRGWNETGKHSSGAPYVSDIRGLRIGIGVAAGVKYRDLMVLEFWVSCFFLLASNFLSLSWESWRRIMERQVNRWDYRLDLQRFGSRRVG